MIQQPNNYHYSHYETLGYSRRPPPAQHLLHGLHQAYPAFSYHKGGDEETAAFLSPSPGPLCHA